MKTWGIMLLLTSIFIPALFLNSTQAGGTSGTLNVVVEGFPDSEGYAMVAVYGSEKAYDEGSPNTFWKRMVRMGLLDSDGPGLFAL